MFDRVRQDEVRRCEEVEPGRDDLRGAQTLETRRSLTSVAIVLENRVGVGRQRAPGAFENSPVNVGVVPHERRPEKETSATDTEQAVVFLSELGQCLHSIEAHLIQLSWVRFSAFTKFTIDVLSFSD